MTYLKIKRIVVVKNGRSWYDELFHNGINIIRGENGSGKSTIANFIYYALGGDFIEWLPEAKSCDFVFAEIEINGNVLTVKREVIDRIMQPMQLFYGSYEAASVSSVNGWQLFPYKKSENKDSFSQVLFKVLQFPEVTTENNESITLNQILRLLYIDQMSALISFIKTVDFDSPLIRQAIGNLMLGTYDDLLFNQQLELRNKKRRFAELKTEFVAVKDVYQNSNQTIDIEAVNQKISEYEENLLKIDITLGNRETLASGLKSAEVSNNIKRFRSNIEISSNEYSSLLSTQAKLETDIIDSEQFLDELKNQDHALTESLSTREQVGNLPLSYCPSCFSKLDPVQDDHVCQLCKQTLVDDDSRSRILRIQHEIKNQIKESSYLLEKRRAELGGLINSIKVAKADLTHQNRILESYIGQSNSLLERKYDELLIRKGELRNEISNLINQKRLIGGYLNLKRTMDRLSSEISALEDIISNKESSHRRNLSIALERIQYYSLQLLKGDGNYESAFASATRIEIDFSKNLYYVDGRNNFSASSLVILKNSIRFGIFFASIDLEFMRLPRFILCDNMEDKGMREERSHNFQKNVVNLASLFSTQFQIIMTTSMIDTSLEVPSYTVGIHYSPENKSLSSH